jgi:hypothetical protein
MINIYYKGNSLEFNRWPSTCVYTHFQCCTDFTEISCEDANWNKLTQNCVQWKAVSFELLDSVIRKSTNLLPFMKMHLLAHSLFSEVEHKTYSHYYLLKLFHYMQ